jgi:hypothetical protein
MLALSLQDVPSDSPAARGLPAAEQSPGPLAPTDGSHLPIPLTHPASTLVRRPRSVAEAGLRAGAARRPAHPTLDRLVGTSKTSPVACRTCPQSGWPPASARVQSPDTRLDTVSADQFLLRTPGIGWPGDGHGGPLDRPVGRTSSVQGDRSPSNVHAVVSGVQLDAMIGQPSGHRLPRRMRPDTVHSTQHAMANQKRCGQGTDERHGRHSDILDRHNHEDGPPGHAEPPAVGPAFAAWQTKAGSAMAPLPARRNHGSGQAATWCRSTVQAAPRRTALLGRFRVESRAGGRRPSVMQSPFIEGRRGC